MYLHRNLGATEPVTSSASLFGQKIANKIVGADLYGLGQNPLKPQITQIKTRSELR
ncbi:hypothetical protein ES703_19346 [subsurface metagenome]